MKKNKILLGQNAERLTLDEIVRIGAEQMLRQALEAEIAAYLSQHSSDTSEKGTSLIVRNGYHDKRNLAVGSGLVEVEVPRTRNRSGAKENFISSLIPP
jgi:transposase-like protein